MALTSSYVQVYGKIPQFLQTIRDGQAPEVFTQTYLKDLGFTSSADRPLISLMKALGFLSTEGVPTDRYHAYRDGSQSRRVMGEALRDAYGDLFTIRAQPSESDRPLIEGKFKSTHNCSDRLAALMAKTFFALLDQADLGASKAWSPEPPAEKTPIEVSGPPLQPATPPLDSAPALHYNIQIHLPATKDVEVYSAIFKSLREHLIG